MEKKLWNLKCKFKYGFCIVLCKKKKRTVFFDFQEKKVFWDLKKAVKKKKFHFSANTRPDLAR